MDYKSEWEQAYLAENKDLKEYNPHEKFSELTGLPYQEAKEVAYRNMFEEDVPFLVKRLMEINKSDLDASYKVAKKLSGKSLTKQKFYKMLEEK